MIGFLLVLFFGIVTVRSIVSSAKRRAAERARAELFRHAILPRGAMFNKE